MLYKNHVLKVQSQHFKQMEREYMKNGWSTGDILICLREMFARNSTLANIYASETLKVFMNMGLCNEDAYYTNYEQLATYGVLMSGVVFGMDYSQGVFSLYTSSTSIIRELAMRSVLVVKRGSTLSELIEKIEKTFYNSDRLRKSLKDGSKFLTVRLDAESIGGKLKMTATIPRTAPTLNTFAFVPFDTLQESWNIIMSEAQTNILKIVASDKTRFVTLNQQLLASIYGTTRSSELLSNAAMRHIPNIHLQKLYLPSVGASKYTFGLSNIRVENIQSISIASLSDIDLSEVNLNYTMVKKYFHKKAEKFTDKRLREVAVGFGLSCPNAPFDDLMGRLIEYADSETGAHLWEKMKFFPKIFKRDELIGMSNIYGTTYQEVPVPQSLKDLAKMLNSGVYKIVSTTRSGGFTTVITTNSNQYLSKILGSDYIKNYESLGVRLGYAKADLAVGRPVDDTLKAYGLDGGITNTSPQALKSYFDTRAYEIQMGTTVIKQNHLLVCRNLEATSKNDFYRNLQLSTIIQIIKLS